MRNLLKNSDYKKDDDAKTGSSSLPVTLAREAVGAVYSRRTGKPTVLGWIIIICTIVYFMTHAFDSNDDEKKDILEEINPRFKVQQMYPLAPDPDPQNEEFMRIAEKNKAGDEPLEVPIFDPNAHKLPKHIIDKREKDIYGHPKPKEYPIPVLKQPDESLICDGEILLLIIHESPVTDVMERNMVRASWGRQPEKNIQEHGKKWATMFVSGLPHSKFKANITNESMKHKDILQGDFIDSPHEGTRKFMLAMDWVVNVLSDTCRPKYIMKTKEKIFHNMAAIVHWIEKHVERDAENYKDKYVGKLLRKDIPIRDPHDFQFVDEDDFSEKYFPDLIQAPEYFFPYDSFRRLHEAKPSVIPVAVEDAYIGLLASKAGVTPKNDNQFVMMRMIKADHECHYASSFFVFNVSPSEHQALNTRVTNSLKSGKCQL